MANVQSLLATGYLADGAPGLSPQQSGDTQLNQFFTLSPDLLGSISLPTQRWTRVNPAFHTILGWNDEDLANHSFFDIVHRDDVERSSATWQALARGELNNLTNRIIHKEGGYRWIAWDTAPDKQNGVLFCTGRDITSTRRTLHSLRALNSRMQRANDELENFANVAGHDLQEPLRTLSLYSELLQRQYGAAIPQEMGECLSTITDATGRMRALVENLLAYARSAKRHPEHGEQTAENVSMEEVFAEVTKNLGSAIEETGATISHDPLPRVRGDEMQLGRVLQNLLSNSLKYRRKDAPVKIHVGVERGECEWLFCVKDNGSGFAQREAEHIFLPFRRLSRRIEVPGTGLGLSICRRIVQQHGGRIWAQSSPGEGATFWFSLPADALS